MRQRTRFPGLLALLTLAPMTVACGGGNKQAFAPKTPFPTRDAIAEVARVPAPPLVAKDVPPAIPYEVEAPAQPTERAPSNVEAQLSVGPRASLAWEPSLRCVAQEVGRFYLANKRTPDPRLTAVIDGVCVTAAPGVRYSISVGTAPASLSEAEVVKAFAPKLDAAKPEQKTGGAFLARKGDEAALVLVTANAAPSLKVTKEGQISLEGTAKAATTQMTAYVNQGTSAVAPCEPQPGLTPPRFAFRCKMMDGDASAWVDVMSHEPGRVLSEVESSVLARRDPTKPIAYAAPRAGAATGATATALLAEINKVRQAAKLPPLTLEPKESDTATQLAGHYFDAALKADGSKIDLICLGLMAGWDVSSGLIKDGAFYSGLVYGTTSAEAWVEYAKDAPSARIALLNPRASTIAIGPLGAENGAGMGALVATYTFWGNTDHKADVNRLFTRIAALRTDRGLPKVTLAPPSKSLDEIAAKVAAGETDPMDGLNTALSNAAYSSGNAVTGWVAAATEIDAIEIPPALLGNDSYRLAITVTHYKPEGSAWGFHLAYMVKMSSTAVTAQNALATQRPM